MTDTRLGYGRAQLDRGSLVEDQPLTFTASTTELNRHGFALRNAGWRLDNFNANPVVLWMHNPFRPPIGQGRALSKDQKIVLDAVTFDREDELARSIESKFRRGFLNAVSVSWDWQLADGTPVTDPWRYSDKEVRDELFYDLAEVSAVTVPGDPRALAQQSRLALARLSDELVELVDEKEHGTALADEIRAGVRAELTRLGIDPALLAAAPSHDTSVAEGEWDANANLSRIDWPTSRSVANRLAAVVRDDQVSDDGVPREAIALPHHFVDSNGNPGAASLAGVRNALARLPQTEGLSDEERAGAERHLRAHLPDDERDTENAAASGLTTEQVQSLRAAFTTEGVTS